jgi:energy-coupling factor transporter ATP-binding protein EcfA2
VILVDAQGIAASRPGKPLFDQLSVTVSSGDRLGVLGVNGCGKSTLLRMLAGTTEPEAGRVLRGRDLVVSVLDQQGALPEGTALAAVEEVAGDASWEAAAVLDRLGLGGHLDALACDVVFPTVVWATDSALFVSAKPQRHTTVCAKLIDQTQTTFGVTESQHFFGQ